MEAIAGQVLVNAPGSGASKDGRNFAVADRRHLELLDTPTLSAPGFVHLKPLPLSATPATRRGWTDKQPAGCQINASSPINGEDFVFIALYFQFPLPTMMPVEDRWS
jgi:hypothetical protein